MATAHMLCGLIGSGKTTFAMDLARSLPALRISLDDWIMTLFGDQAPAPMTFEWWMDHAARCSRFSWTIAEQALEAGLDVVLDCGFLTRAHRAEDRERARQAGANVKLYHLVADRDLRYARIMRRNQERGKNFALTVTHDMFDSLHFDPPSEDELVGGEVIDTTERG